MMMRIPVRRYQHNLSTFSEKAKQTYYFWEKLMLRIVHIQSFMALNVPSEVIFNFRYQAVKVFLVRDDELVVLKVRMSIVKERTNEN